MDDKNYSIDPVLETLHQTGMLDDDACDEILAQKEGTAKEVRDIIVDGGYMS